MTDIQETNPSVSANSKPPKSVAAIVALVVAIVALALSLVPIINNLAFFLAIVALVFGVVGLVGIKKGKKSGMALAVAALIITLIAGGAVLASQAAYSAALDEASASFQSDMDKMTGDATDEILGNDVEVTLGDFSIKKDGYGIITSKLPVTVKNLRDESTTFDIQIEAVDESGQRIDDSFVYANSLGSGQSQTLEAFTYVSEDNYNVMKAAKFAIVSVSEY